MPFPEENPESDVPIMVSYCIDYRYDSMTAEFLAGIGYQNSYYISTNAGAALSLGYNKSCQGDNCGCRHSHNHHHHHENNENETECCPGTESMRVLRKSFTTNLEIALTLQPIDTVYLINHQDWGAIRAFLPCSGYPASDEQNKTKEICINEKILKHAAKYVKKKFDNMEVVLGLIDVNGTVADYDKVTKQWTIIYVGSGVNVDGLWYGYNLNDVITFNC